MVSMHYNAIDNAAKLTAGSSEVKMINRTNARPALVS